MCWGLAAQISSQHPLRVLPQHIAPFFSRHKLLCRQNCKDKQRVWLQKHSTGEFLFNYFTKFSWPTGWILVCISRVGKIISGVLALSVVKKKKYQDLKIELNMVGKFRSSSEKKGLGYTSTWLECKWKAITKPQTTLFLQATSQFYPMGGSFHFGYPHI